MLADCAESLNGYARSSELDLAKILRDLGRDRETESRGANLIKGDAADLPRQSDRAPDLVVHPRHRALVEPHVGADDVVGDVADGVRKCTDDLLLALSGHL